MPFSQDLLDTYVLGIREPLSVNGYACTRTDELEFDGRVMDKIYDLIRSDPHRRFDRGGGYRA